ncbi:MAG TPA: CocE/NonD family hydrolase [Candidatus Thermoplasmatota archaeon]|nr:CocE/NonD family hydrolase [Candidatus Thermoplasmatota archaeon]
MRTALLVFLLSATALAGCLHAAPGAPVATGTGVAAGAGEAVGGSLERVVSVPPGAYDFTGPFSRVLQKGALAVKAVEHVYAPGPDGADMEMGVWRPDTKERVPVLVHASPYYGFTMAAGTRVTDKVGYYGNLVDNFVPHGYAVVGLAIRGTGDSGGCNDLMGPKEVADLDAAITWLGEQPWSNGNVAMIGISYDGSTPWSAAATGNPHLKTIIPQDGVPDVYGLMYRNGSSEQRGPLVLNGLYFAGDAATDGAKPQNVATRVLCPDAAQGLALSAYSGATGAPDPLGFWEARNRKPLVERNYKGSVFSVQGLKDFNVDPSMVIPWVDRLDGLGIRTRQLIGQWQHQYPDTIGKDGKTAKDFRADFNQAVLLWLDHELKGLPADAAPAVQVRDDGGRWRNEAHYPPHDTVWTSYNLTNGFLRVGETPPRQSLMLLPHASEGVPPQLPPTVAASPHAAADFDTAPLDRETLVVGLPKVPVTVTPQGPGGYMAAFLYDVAPDGKMRTMGYTTMNLAFADGGRERHEVVPGVPLQVNFELQPLDSVVPAGHQIRLRLWVFTDGDRLPTLPPSSVTLETGPGIRSLLELPTVTRDPSVYFQPPVPAK